MMMVSPLGEGQGLICEVFFHVLEFFFDAFGGADVDDALVREQDVAAALQVRSGGFDLHWMERPLCFLGSDSKLLRGLTNMEAIHSRMGSSRDFFQSGDELRRQIWVVVPII